MSNPQVDLQHIENLTTLSRAKGFLGREFLTWLWYTAETKKDRLTIFGPQSSQKYELDLWIDDRLLLESSSGLSHENLLKGGDPSHSEEAAAALQSGKMVRELKLGVNITGLGDFHGIFSCDNLTPRGLKLPDAEADDTGKKELPLARRLALTEHFLEAMDGLFALFLESRTADEWSSKDLPKLKQWIKSRGESSKPTLH